MCFVFASHYDFGIHIHIFVLAQTAIEKKMYTGPVCRIMALFISQTINQSTKSKSDSRQPTYMIKHLNNFESLYVIHQSLHRKFIEG